MRANRLVCVPPAPDTHRNWITSSVLLLVLLALPMVGAGLIRPGGLATQAPMRTNSSTAKAKAADAYAKLPIYFVPNKGQLPGKVAFYAQGAGYSFYLTGEGVTYAFTRSKAKGSSGISANKSKDPDRVQPTQGYVLRTRFAGANPSAAITGQDPTKARVNYFKGADPSSWQTGISTYRAATYKSLYPGIDATYMGAGGKIKYQFTLRPGADYKRVALAYEGADSLKLDRAGNLIIGTPWGNLKDERPVAYQMVDGKRVPVPAAFHISAKTAGFRLGNYNPNFPVIIDPGLVYSTFLGGSDYDGGNDIALDSAGSAYVTGYTSDATTDYPTTVGAYDQMHNGNYDVFVTKLSASGGGLAYSTFLGGSGNDWGYGIALDSAGNAYVTGRTDDATTDYPTTPGAYDQMHNGGSDVFVTKLSSGGSSLSYSTFLGGSGPDGGYGIALDSAGNAYVTGQTLNAATDYPTTPGAYDQSHNGGSDAFVTKLSSGGSSLSYSTFLGGSAADWGNGIALGSAGNAYVTGYATDSTLNYPTTPGAYDQTHNGADDVFVTKLSADGGSLLYSTFLGGSADDIGRGMAVNSADNAYVTGLTDDAATDYPTTPGAYDQSHNGNEDAFVTKLSSGGSSLSYSTFLGGSGNDWGYGIALDSAGYAHVTGHTWDSTTDYPTSVGAYDRTHNGDNDAFVTKLSAGGGSLVYSSFLGGSGTDEGHGIAIDSAGYVYLTGQTGDAAIDYPTTASAYDQIHNGSTDAFVTKLLVSRAYLSTPWLSPSIPTHGRYFYTYGYLKPRHYGYTRLYFYRRIYYRGRYLWKYHAYRNAINYRYSSYTRYRLYYRLPYAGRWYVRAYHSDSNHLPTWSPIRYFTVR